MRISGCREWQSCSLPCNETDSGKKRGHSPSSSRRHVGREPRGNPRCFSPVKTSYFSVRESTFSEIRLKTIQKKRCDFWESRRVLGFITQKMDSPFFMKRRKVVVMIRTAERRKRWCVRSSLSRFALFESEKIFTWYRRRMMCRPFVGQGS